MHRYSSSFSSISWSICFAAAVTVRYKSCVLKRHRSLQANSFLLHWNNSLQSKQIWIKLNNNKPANQIVKKLRLQPINHEKISSDSKLCSFALVVNNHDFFSSSSNYHEDNEGLINRQINLELYASYAYMAMAHHFDRSDVALKGTKWSIWS